MHNSDQSTNLLQPGDLQALGALRGGRRPLFSLYLDLRQGGNLLERFEARLAEAARQRQLELDPPEYRQGWEQAAADLRAALAGGSEALPGGSPGLAAFAGASEGLPRVLRLPAAVLERLVIDQKLFLLPLEVLLGEDVHRGAERDIQRREQEGKLETRRVQELIRRAERHEGAVLGLDAVLLAARDRRIALLVVEQDFSRAGGECPNCGFLGEGTGRPFASTGAGSQKVCPLCGVALRQHADIIEVALRRVLEKGGEIEVLRSEEARRGLQDYGRIGALIEAGDAAPKDSANQRALTKGGKVNREALRDETGEESFPASDPPSGW